MCSQCYKTSSLTLNMEWNMADVLLIRVDVSSTCSIWSLRASTLVETLTRCQRSQPAFSLSILSESQHVRVLCTSIRWTRNGDFPFQMRIMSKAGIRWREIVQGRDKVSMSHCSLTGAWRSTTSHRITSQDYPVASTPSRHTIATQ